MIKKICFVILSRANYSSIKSVIKELKRNKKFKIFIVVGASAIQDKYGNVAEIIKKDFKIGYFANMPVFSDDPMGMAQCVGNGLIELPNIFNKIKPDLVFTVGDRFETMSTVLSAAYMNIPIAHTMGGEVSGTIDESIRHAITKFSHLHFVSNKDSFNRVLRLGEKKENIFNVGCPRNDLIKNELKKKNLERSFNFLNSVGVGVNINKNDKFIIVSQHPVTTEYKSSDNQIALTLNAIRKLNMKCLLLWPNSDSGSDKISKKIRIYREKKLLTNFRLIKNLPTDIYINIMNNCQCIVGNSSSAIRDGSFLGIPAVNIGSRQNKRLKSFNVINAEYNEQEIFNKVKKQLKIKKYKKSKIYGDGNSAKKIAKILKKLKNVKIQKTITY